MRPRPRPGRSRAWQPPARTKNRKPSVTSRRLAEYWAFPGQHQCPSFLAADLQHREEGLLRDLDLAELLHALLAFFLLLEQLALARDVAAVALGEHVLAQRLDGRAGDHVRADRGLDG